MWGQIAYDWNTMPRLRWCGGTKSRRPGEATRRPRRLISPPSGRSSPATRRSVVVLPQPLGPSSVNSSPRSIWSETPSTAAIEPKSLVTPSRARSVSPAPGFAAPTPGLALLDDGLGDVLRLDHLGEVLLGVDLEELGPLGHRVRRVPRLHADSPAVGLDLSRPHH